MEYPSQSPYIIAHDNPIAVIDFKGLGDGNKKQFTKKDLTTAVSNAKAGEQDDESDKKGRNCGMCCLNALTSNLKIITGTTVKKKETIEKTLLGLTKKGFAGKEINVYPRNDGKIVSSKTNGAVDDNTSTGIPDKLLELTENKPGIYFFAVGIAAGYHSTVIAVVTDGTAVTDVNGKTMTGTVKNPMYVYMEDIGGVTVMNRKELGDEARNLLFHAQNYYQGSPVEGKTYANPDQDVSLKGQIWPLYHK